MGRAENGDTVTVDYTGKLEDGTVFDSSEDREPLEFTIGEDQVIPGFEKAVVGMNPGESKTAKLPVEEAYGPRRDDMVFEVDPAQFPEDLDPEVGERLQVRQETGETFEVTVADVGESAVTLDANHPLAGRELTFDIELKEIG